MNELHPAPPAATMTWVITALIDGNVLDYLADHPDALTAARAALDAGTIRLISTHILGDELDPMKPGKRERRQELDAVIEALNFETVTTAGFVLDRSRLDHADPMSDPDVELYDALIKQNPRHAEDALLTLTARRDDTLLVTADKTLFGRATEQNIPVVNPPAFAWLAQHQSR
jgi:rRNA-processing protein FCF1